MASATENGNSNVKGDLASSAKLPHSPMEDFASHLRNLLKDAERNLVEQCTKWTEIKENKEIPEIVIGEICSVIGQAQLLISQKMAQLVCLISDHELGRYEKPIGSTDLQGFWDMINIQIQDVRQKFGHLETCRQNQWSMPAALVKTPRSARKTSKPSPLTSVHRSIRESYVSPTRRYIADARKRLTSSSSDQFEIAASPVTTPLRTPKKPTMDIVFF